MPFNNLPSETVLAIASFLPRKDTSALARTSRRMCSIAEIQLYASVELEMGWSSYNLDKHPLNHFLESLMAKKERCIYVQSVSIGFDRDLLYRDQVMLRALIDVLPCLRTFSFRCNRSIEFSGNTTSSVAQRRRSHHARFESSLRASKGIVPSRPCTADEALTLSWSNQFDFNGPFFVSFVSLHSNIRCLNLLQIYDNNLPKMDASVLPNLESLQAQITVVLALLPGRKIQRVKTHFFGIKDGWEDKKTDACGEAFKEDTPELENIKAFTCRRTWTKAGGFMSFLIRKMKNIEILDLSFVSLFETSLLNDTSVQLLKLQGCIPEDDAAHLFKAVGTLECIECLNGEVYRLYRDGKRTSNVVWRCEVWLADWKKDSYAY